MKTLKLFLLISFCVSLAIAGLRKNSVGGPPPLIHKSHNSNSGAHQNHIKGGIGDGYIYPVKNNHNNGGSGAVGKSKTYKIIIQNGGSHRSIPKYQGAKVKTFKVITQNKASGSHPVHSTSVKTIKLIRLKGDDGINGHPNSRHGWQ